MVKLFYNSIYISSKNEGVDLVKTVKAYNNFHFITTV